MSGRSGPNEICGVAAEPWGRRLSQRQGNQHSGITLVEVVTVLALMTLAGTLFTEVFLSAQRLNRYSQNRFDRLSNLGTMGASFRADVAAATAVVDQLGDYRSGSDTLILSFLPDKSPIPQASQVIWHWKPIEQEEGNQGGGRLQRIRWEGRVAQPVWVSLHEQYEEASFQITKQGETSVVTMRLRPPPPPWRKEREDLFPEVTFPDIEEYVVQAVVGADRQ